MLLIDPEIKPDIQDARERLIAWWNREDIGRPALLVRTSHEGLPEAEARIPVPNSLADQWTDPEYHVKRAQTIARGTFWGAEMMPFYFAWTGAVCLSSALGAQVELKDRESVWWKPCIDSWEDALPLRYDPEADWWRRTRILAQELTRNANGAYIPAFPDPGAPGDIIAAIRGTTKTCLDLLDKPASLKTALRQVCQIWEDTIDEVYGWVDCARLGSIAEWTTIWHPKKTYPTQNDISALVSPGHFREFFLPGVVAQCKKVEGAIFHLDGPEALGTVDAILEIPEIRVIEWSTDPTKDGDVRQWMDLYHKILTAGKNLLLFVRLDEVEFLCRNLPRVGLILHVDCGSPQHASRLIDSTYEWSHK